MNDYTESGVSKGGLDLVDLTQTKYSEVATRANFQLNKTQTLKRRPRVVFIGRLEGIFVQPWKRGRNPP